MRVNLGYSSPANRTYRIRGATLEDAFNALVAHGWWGRYRSNWSWRARGRGTITQISIKAKPVITMPIWAEKRRATRAEIKEWDRMHAVLLRHEQNHHTIFDDAARALKTELENGGDLEEREVSTRMERFTNETQKAQNRYDSRTRHGQSEGVNLTIP